MTAGPQYFVYILRCSDGSYYIGSTAELAGRVAMHNTGRGPQYTACRLPVELVYLEPFETMQAARQRETQVKKWSRAKKEALIASDKSTLKRLSKRRTRASI